MFPLQFGIACRHGRLFQAGFFQTRQRAFNAANGQNKPLMCQCLDPPLLRKDTRFASERNRESNVRGHRFPRKIPCCPLTLRRCHRKGGAPANRLMSPPRKWPVLAKTVEL